MKPNSGQKKKEGAEPPAPSHEEIARRAYELALKRGGEPGREQEDWLQAEKDLRAEKTRPS